MRYTFVLTLDAQNDEMTYVCDACGVAEFVRPVGNPVLPSAIRAHLREGHSLVPGERFHVSIIQNSDTSGDVVCSPLPFQESAEEHVSRQDLPAPVLPSRTIEREFLVDTNCVNARQSNFSLNRLEAWSEARVIRLLTSEVAQTEMLGGSDPRRTAKAYSYLFTVSEIESAHETRLLRRIEEILFPEGVKTLSQKNDAEIVFNAGKYHRPLITMDGASKTQPHGILGSRFLLAGLGVEVLTPEEAVAIVTQAIACRDDAARRIAAITNALLPEWVGQD